MCVRVRTHTLQLGNRYWQPEEHQRFLKGLRTYGHKDIKSIAKAVGTRSTTQVRVHVHAWHACMCVGVCVLARARVRVRVRACVLAPALFKAVGAFNNPGIPPPHFPLPHPCRYERTRRSILRS